MTTRALTAAAALSLATGLILSLSGCAARDVDTGYAEREAACVVVTGDPDEPWLARTPGEPWTDGGSQYVVCEAWEQDPAGDVQVGDEDDGVRPETLRSAYVFAFDRLRSRGVRFSDEQVERMVEERVEAALRGEEVAFPRIRAAGRLVESCSYPRSGTSGWRERLLAEYPIAYLRGDANNALWHAGRAVNEAGVVTGSARSFFSEGRWFDGLLELVRAGRLLGSASDVAGREAAREEVERLTSWALGALSITPVVDVVVLERGQRREVAVEFSCSYDWDGRTVAAVGVPVDFRLHGLAAVCTSDPESDGSGVAVCRIVSAHGALGECSIEPLVDVAVLSAALGEDAPKSVAAATRAQRVFLVEGAHAVSVCLEVRGLDRSDEAQLRGGFERRAESDGFVVEDCGVGVGVVLSAEAVKTNRESADGWSSSVVVEVSAFDQRVARETGATTISVEERTGDDAREAEVLALKEAGRLMAAYFSNRMLLLRE